MKHTIRFLTIFALFLAMAPLDAEPRGEVIQKPVEMRVVGGRIDGKVIRNPIVLLKNGSVLLADKAIILDDRVRFEGSPELRKARTFFHSEDPNAWIEMFADGTSRMSPGKWDLKDAQP